MRLDLPEPVGPPRVLDAGACTTSPHPGFISDPPSRRADARTRAAYQDLVRELRSICAGCPVLAECRDYAIVATDFTFLGGMTGAERVAARGYALPVHSVEEQRVAAAVRDRVRRGEATASIVADYGADGVCARTVERWRNRIAN
jgi:hypothetical protein